MVGETNNCIAYYYHTVHILYKITFLQRSLILILKKMDQVALLLIIQDFFLFKLQTFTQMKKKIQNSILKRQIFCIWLKNAN